jgi:putative ATP-dependent endonuclease of the OLD family
MIITSAHLKEHACFRNSWAGFDGFCPVNVIVGRNNSGKSRLLDLVKELCLPQANSGEWPLRLSGTLDEQSLRMAFHVQHVDNGLPGNHWYDNGRLLVDKKVFWTRKGNALSDISVEISDGKYLCDGPKIDRLRASVLPTFSSPFASRKFVHLSADRDIQPETASVSLALESDGRGATNVVRRFLTSSSFDKRIIQRDLLNALNDVFGDDGQFTMVDALQHDSDGRNYWEVYLEEQHKGSIALSKSGSGLKTVILVLLNLLVVPKFEPLSKLSDPVFAFEELENNLHPALLRRLLAYIESHALRSNSPVFLTTHSPVMIDVLGAASHAQIVHVTHDGRTGTTKRIGAHFDKLDALSTLGARPSDLLQANGVVWVEGPSDRIYVNRWIELASNGELKEGRHYQCAYYGGSLLARYQATAPDEEASELANLLRINSNICLICDSDLSLKRGQLKPRVVRLQDELRKIPGAFMWITSAKEIENYLPGEVLSSVFGLVDLPSPSQFEFFFEADGQRSYQKNRLGKKTLDKVELAALCAPLLSTQLLLSRFDWQDQMNALVAKVRIWNA